MAISDGNIILQAYSVARLTLILISTTDSDRILVFFLPEERSILTFDIASVLQTGLKEREEK